MTGPLDDIIEGATDDAVSTSNLLRKVQVVAHRLGATEILEWASRELNGFNSVDDLPPYRADLTTNVLGTWAGPFNARLQGVLSAGSIPEQAAKVLFRVNMSQSVSELEELISASDGKREMGIPWDPEHVGMYNQWIDEGKVPYIEMMGVQSANRVITRGMMRSIIDSARNTALGFALDLQAAAPDAGTAGGPTMAEAPVAHVVNNYYETHITGDGNQVAQGKDIRQRAKVVKNDLESLLAAVRQLGLESAGTDELARVVLADDAKRPHKVQKFLAAVRAGAFAIGTGMTADVAANQISDLIAAYLG
ncbi:hypothetical protein BH09ACT3_BH09ACT3_08620 [soil metagenome]